MFRNKLYEFPEILEQFPDIVFMFSANSTFPKTNQTDSAACNDKELSKILEDKAATDVEFENLVSGTF